MSEQTTTDRPQQDQPPQKIRRETPDPVAGNVEKIAQLFPGCVTEAADPQTGELKRAIDFDALRQELSGEVVEGPRERYRLDWPGKREATLAANTPISKTLRPAREESVNFDTTQNLFIEGDNLDALKLLQETYLGKVKMIFIDPPYNTGKEFIYDDDFSEDAGDYKRRSGQQDEAGGKLVPNPETKGRYHSDWLSMMLPRLKLARNLLKEDGVIFVSIDDHEVAQTRRLLDEVFGEGQFEGHIHWRRRTNQPNDASKMIGLVAEHVLAFSRDTAALKAYGPGKVPLTGSFSNPDDDPRGPWATKPWKAGSDQSGSRYQITTPTGRELNEEWLGEQQTFQRLLADERIVFTRNGDGDPRKKYFKSEREEEGQCANNWWSHEQFGSNQSGNDRVTSLMGGLKNVFSNPKPVELVEGLISVAGCVSGDMVIDFFAGSGTTADAASMHHAALRWILVQYPEPIELSAKTENTIAICDQTGRAYLISEVAKERIKRSLAELGESNPGFRVLKIASSNFKDIRAAPDATPQASLLDRVDNVKDDRTGEDLLFGVLLDWGVDLGLPIARETIRGHEVFFVDTDALAACFEPGLDDAFMKELAARKPLRAVFRDASYGSDAAKINAVQLFRQLSPTTEVRTL